VKILKPEFAANRDLVQRFLNEARAANAIHHPYIIDIIDVGLLPEGVPYMMMEFLAGESLAARNPTGAAPVRERGGEACPANRLGLGRRACRWQSFIAI